MKTKTSTGEERDDPLALLRFAVERAHLEANMLSVDIRLSIPIIGLLPAVGRKIAIRVLQLTSPALAVPTANQIRVYWWCSPPRIGRQRNASNCLGGA